jgi:hypothetical protein
MTKTSTDTFYEVRLAFTVSRELISDENWDNDELNLLVDKLTDTADAYFHDKGIEMEDFSTSAGRLNDRPEMDWFSKSSDNPLWGSE